MGIFYCNGIVVHYEFIPEGKTVKKKRILTSFVALEPKGGFFFTTMLQHTGRIWSRVS